MIIDFKKHENGLVPAIIQDSMTKNVLMLGYMNEDAFRKTEELKKATFFSRSKNRLWTKGEESGNFLNVIEMKVDCDHDTLLVLVTPEGPTCHKGTDSCWGEANRSTFGFLSYLEEIIEDRKNGTNQQNSYVASLFRKGMNKIAQKVGEEAVEVIIEAKDENDLDFLNESADLLFHFMILLQAKGFHMRDIEKILQSRHKHDRNE